jgi:hypothetical protein
VDEAVLVAANLHAVTPEKVDEFLKTLIDVTREAQQVPVVFEVLIQCLESLLDTLAFVGLTAWFVRLSPAFLTLLIGLGSDE